jgi:hypothetical protein
LIVEAEEVVEALETEVVVVVEEEEEVASIEVPQKELSHSLSTIKQLKVSCVVTPLTKRCHS